MDGVATLPKNIPPPIMPAPMLIGISIPALHFSASSSKSNAPGNIENRRLNTIKPLNQCSHFKHKYLYFVRFNVSAAVLLSIRYPGM